MRFCYHVVHLLCDISMNKGSNLLQHYVEEVCHQLRSQQRTAAIFCERKDSWLVKVFSAA